MNYHFQPIGGAVMKCMWCGQSEVTMTRKSLVLKTALQSQNLNSHFGSMPQL